MRACVIALVIVAGCLHAQTPVTPHRTTDPSVLSEFGRLVGNPNRLDDASAFVAEHHLSREEISAGAAPAYAAFMRMEAYALAAEIAWRFDFGQTAIIAPAALERDRARMSAGQYLSGRTGPDSVSLRLRAVSELRDEALISCFYGKRAEDAQAAVDDAIAFRAAAFDDDVLFPLLTARCPVKPEWRSLIIDLAFGRAMDAYAIRHAAAAEWLPEQKVRFAWGFFLAHRCGPGFQAVAALRVPSFEVVPMVEKSECEQAVIATEGWSLPEDDARSYFFAAVRNAKYNLAFTLLPSCGFDENGRLYLFQEGLRSGHGSDLVKVLAYHPGNHDALMQYAYDQGRYRFVGNYAQTFDWERRAFDKLLEIGQYDFAGEVAQYGFSETLRTEGIVLAFQAAMKAGNFKMGGYFVARYGTATQSRPALVTQAMYEEEKKKWYDARAAAPLPPTATSAPPPPPKAKRRPPTRPACPKGDWCVGDGK